MFCNKCGKELSDNATFCSGCGNQVGAAPAAAPQAAPASLPPIISRFVSQVTNFFTKKDPIGVVANSAKDNSFSGAILAVIGALLFAISAAVNVNQGVISYFKAMYEDAWSNKIAKEIAKSFPTGNSFGMFLLLAVAVFAVSAIMVYVVTNNIAKKHISFSGAINVVAYASIPIIAVSVINMILGLIWFALPVFFMVIALFATVLILGSAVDVVTENAKPLTCKLLVIGLAAVTALIFMWIACKSINEVKNKENFISFYISNFLLDK